MKSINLQTLAEWIDGSLLQGEPTVRVECISSDTRRIPDHALFVALKGERYDAHDFLATAADAGAAALLVSCDGPFPNNTAVIQVRDTLTGLQNLAQRWRREWNGIVVGITGSNGKTSTKDIVTAVLSRRWSVNSTSGNFNNHIGLPLTVLETQPIHQVAVCEMGMNHPGEIAPLAAIAAPDIAIITNVGTAHIEHMGSREAIALEKGMLAEAIPKGGCVILNANDEFTPSIRARCSAPTLSAGFDKGDVQVSDYSQTIVGSRFRLSLPDGTAHEVAMPVFGRHMAGNAALAAAAAYHMGMHIEEIATGLENAHLNKGRLQPRTVAGLSFIDDSYNANPDSMRAAMATLQSLPCEGRRIAVLGRMGELGLHSIPEHGALGMAARGYDVDILLACGEDDSRLITTGWSHNAHHFPDHSSTAAWLRQYARPSDLILVKGSRSAVMEKIIDQLST